MRMIALENGIELLGELNDIVHPLRTSRISLAVFGSRSLESTIIQAQGFYFSFPRPFDHENNSKVVWLFYVHR